MTDYVEEILTIIDSEDIFPSTISFSEESIQIDYMDRAQQGKTVNFGATAIIQVNDKESLEAYRVLQDIARTLVRDALVRRRLERESEG